MQFQSLLGKKLPVMGSLYFLIKVISHVNAILGLNPYTGKVESEQVIVVIKERVEL